MQQEKKMLVLLNNKRVSEIREPICDIVGSSEMLMKEGKKALRSSGHYCLLLQRLIFFCLPAASEGDDTLSGQHLTTLFAYLSVSVLYVDVCYFCGSVISFKKKKKLYSVKV